MNQPHRHKNSLGLALVLAFALGVSLFFSACSPAPQRVETTTVVELVETEQAVRFPSTTPTLTNAQKAAITPTAVPPTPIDLGQAVTPTATPGTRPPACTFPLAKITMAESKSETYTFSEPKVVLTAQEGNPLNVAQWLPDNQQVLVAEELRNQYVESNDTTIQEAISLYDIRRGESKLYATRATTGGPLMLLPDTNGVVYLSANYTHIDKKHGDYKYTLQLRVSYGNPDATQLLADNLAQYPLVNPYGSEILYFLGKKISKLDKSLKKISSASFDPDQWDYAKERRDKNPVRYRMAWQPGTSLVFLYSGAGAMSRNGGYTFILDTTTGHVCELNFGGWSDGAHWSPNGRYLAIVRSKSYTGLDDSPGVVVLDSVTGNLRTVGAISPDAKGKHYVVDFTWAPDSLHLLTLENVPSTYDPYRDPVHHELYLVDITSDQSIHLFPELKWFAINIPPQNSFVWSPDGSKLLVHCPLRETGRYCLLSVQRTGQ